MYDAGQNLCFQPDLICQLHFKKLTCLNLYYGLPQSSSQKTMNSATRMLPTLLTTYAGKGRLLLLTVDIGVCDVALGLIELGDYLRVLNRTRIHRPVHLISFVRRVNRRSMRIHKRPASSWLRYLKAREHQWVSDTVHAVVAAGKKVDAVVIEDLNNEALKRKLRSEDPDTSARYSTWMPAKLQRRIIAACVNKNIPILKIPPQYSSHICPRCSRMMADAGRRRVQCTFCGMNDDRDNIAIVNLARTAAVASGLQYLTNNLGQELRKYEQTLSSTKLGKQASKTPAQSLQGGIPSLGGVGEAAGHPTHRGQEPPGGFGWFATYEPFSHDLGWSSRDTPAAGGTPRTVDGKIGCQVLSLPGYPEKALGGENNDDRRRRPEEGTSQTLSHFFLFRAILLRTRRLGITLSEPLQLFKVVDEN